MIRPLYIWLGSVAIAALVTFAWLTVSAPSIMMSLALFRVERGDAPSLSHPDAVGRNKMFASQLVDERYGPDAYYLFTRPNPDILYSGCSYDLKDGPIEVGMRNPPEYASIALHDAHTNNFGVVGNKDVSDEYVRLLIVRQGTPSPVSFEGPVFESPTRRGMALPRILAEDRGDMDRYLAFQSDQYCHPYQP